MQSNNADHLTKTFQGYDQSKYYFKALYSTYKKNTINLLTDLIKNIL